MPDAVAPGWTELGPCGPRAPAAQQRPVRFTQDALEKVSPFYGGCFWFLRGGGGEEQYKRLQTLQRPPFHLRARWLTYPGSRAVHFLKRKCLTSLIVFPLSTFFFVFSFFLGGWGSIPGRAAVDKDKTLQKGR